VAKEPGSYRVRTFLKLWSDVNYDPEMIRECMNTVGFSPKTSIDSIKGNSRRLLECALADAGLSLHSIAKRHRMIMDNAKHPKYNTPDHAVRLQAVKMAYEVHDAMPKPELNIHKTEEITATVSIKTLQRASEASGENIIDVTPEEDKEEHANGTENGTESARPRSSGRVIRSL